MRHGANILLLADLSKSNNHLNTPCNLFDEILLDERKSSIKIKEACKEFYL